MNVQGAETDAKFTNSIELEVTDPKDSPESISSDPNE